MNNLITRTLTGIFLVLLVLLSVIWNPIPFAVLFMAFSILGLWEYYRIMKDNITLSQIYIGLLAGGCVYILLALVSLNILSPDILLYNFGILILIFTFTLFTNGKNTIYSVGIIVLGILYIVVPLGLLNYFLVQPEPATSYDPSFLIGFLIVQWGYDIFAYVNGKLFGKIPLYPKISPNKTWEGVIVGGIFALMITAFINYYLCDLMLINWIVIGMIVIIFGTLGDLTESMIKRNTDIKDTGNILPGHGGVLDRFDGVLFSAPMVFIYYNLII